MQRGALLTNFQDETITRQSNYPVINKKENIMIQLKNDYWLPYGEESPMDNHKGGEIAADDENKVFYVHEVLVVTNGLDSIVKACMSYPV